MGRCLRLCPRWHSFTGKQYWLSTTDYVHIACLNKIRNHLTEKEALGLVWGIDKLHLYLYHTNFEMIVDHMPLNFIFDTKNCPSARVERWQMKLQRYSFNVI